MRYAVIDHFDLIAGEFFTLREAREFVETFGKENFRGIYDYELDGYLYYYHDDGTEME